MILTTSRNATSSVKLFSKTLSLQLPLSTYNPRGKNEIREISKKASFLGHKKIIVVSKKDDKFVLQVLENLIEIKSITISNPIFKPIKHGKQVEDIKSIPKELEILFDYDEEILNEIIDPDSENSFEINKSKGKINVICVQDENKIIEFDIYE